MTHAQVAQNMIQLNEHRPHTLRALYDFYKGTTREKDWLDQSFVERATQAGIIASHGAAEDGKVLTSTIQLSPEARDIFDKRTELEGTRLTIYAWID